MRTDKEIQAGLDDIALQVLNTEDVADWDVVLIVARVRNSDGSYRVHQAEVVAEKAAAKLAGVAAGAAHLILKHMKV